mmetsp:Transcript_27888/g.27571  ORF Transcript_27888/g.27571 Transcript_27888/m.27571 type:complete len:220 (-) Transcript_27888:29-688(-)
MKRRGKGVYVDFDGNERAALRTLFRELDTDKSGAISSGEFFEPLLALGLVEKKDQVKSLISKVDTDGSGVIEFEEFLQIIKTAKGMQGKNLLLDFFKDLISGNIYQEHKDLPFKLLMSNKRRELMLQTYLGGTPNMREKGLKVLHAYANELNEKEDEKSKTERLIEKKTTHMKKLLERRDGMKTFREARLSQDSVFLTNFVATPVPTSRRTNKRHIFRN